MQETEQVGIDPIKSIYNDLGLETEGIKYESFEATFKNNPKARESIYKDLGFKEEGITFETFENKLGFKNKPGFQYSKPFNTAPTKQVPDLLTQRPKSIQEDNGFRKVHTNRPPIQKVTPTINIDDQKEFGNRLAKQQHEEKIGASYKNLLPQMAHEIPKSVYTTLGNALKREVNHLSSKQGTDTNTDDPSDSLGEQYFRKVFGIFNDDVNASDLVNMANPASAFETIANKLKNASISQKDKDYAIEELSKASASLDGRIKMMNDWQSENPVPENIGTNTAKTISGMLPDIAMAGLGNGSTGAVAEKYVTGIASKAPELIKKYAPKAAALLERSITAPFTKVLTAKGAYEGGALNTDDPTQGLVTGSIHGAAEGIYMHILGEGANKISPYISNLIGKTGTTSEISTALANPLANAGVFSTAKVIRTPLEEGRMATTDELAHEAALGIGFSLLHAGSTFKNHSDKNTFYKNVLKTDSKAALSRVLNEDISIVKDNYRPDINIKRLEEARDEIKEQILKNPDLAEKDILGQEGIRIQNTIDAKDAIDGIINNKKSLLEIIDASGLPLEKAEMMKVKIENLHKEYNPDEVLKTEVSKNIIANKTKVKELKERISDDPIENAEREIELDTASEEIKKDSEKLKTIFLSTRSPVADLTPGEHFYTVDGTKHQSTGRDLSTATIYNETGKSIPFDQVDITRTQLEQTKGKEIQSEKHVEVIEPATEQVSVSAPDITQKNKESVQVLEPSLKETEKPGLTTVDPRSKSIELAGGEKNEHTNSAVTTPVKEVAPEINAPLSLREIDKITRTSMSPEPDLSKKQGYQAVLKKKFNDLYKVSPENLDAKVGEFVGTVHEYRNKNRIKSDKVYSENGTKESLNGLNYWIDSAIGLYAKSSGKSKSSSTQEITRMRSDWAKERIPKEIKADQEIPDNIVIEPKKLRATKEAKANPFKEEIEKLSDENLLTKKSEIEQREGVKSEVASDNMSDNGLAEIGITSSGKPIFVLKENVAEYEKFTKAIEKKLERIEKSDFAEGSNAATERAIIDKLKLRLKDLEIKPASFKISVTESAKEATLLNNIEMELNESVDNINPKIQTTGKNAKTIEYINKVQPVLFKLFPGIKFKVYDTTSEYTEKTGRPALSAGSFNRKNRSISLNLELINKYGAEQTVYHEAIHPIVDAIFYNNPKALAKAVKKIGELNAEPGYLEIYEHSEQYLSRGNETVQIEFVTEFLTKSVDGTIDYSKLSKSGITKVKEVFNQLLELLGISKKFNTGEDIAKLAHELKRAIEIRDSTSLESTIGKKNINSLDGKYDAILDNILSKPDAFTDITKSVVHSLGSKQLKSVIGLEKALIKLVNDGVLNETEVASISDVQKKNLLKLVKSDQERISSAKTPGELMTERHKENKQAVKSIEREKGLFTKKSVDAARENLWDYSGNLVKTLTKDGSFVPVKSTALTETYGQRAERLLKTIPAAYSKASSKYEEAMSKVYGSGIFGEGKVKSLSEGEQKLMSDIAMYQRVIELDTQRLADGEVLIKHPGGLDLVQAKQKMAELASHDLSIIEQFGKYEFDNLKGRVDEYYKVLQDLIDYRFANGLISGSAYEKLKGIKYYSPRVFLKHLTDSDGFYSNKPLINKAIKSINEGSEGEVVTNLAKIMADAINITYEVSARNASTKAIAEIIEENPDVEWGKTARYTPEFIDRLKKRQEENDESSPAISGADEVRVDEVSKYKHIEPSFRPAPKGFELKIYRDGGIKRGFYIKSELSKELDGLRLDANKWLVQASLAPTVRTLATATNWYFAIPNTLRDAQYALFTTSHYSNHLPIAAAQYTADFISSLKDSFTKSGEYKKYIEQGGGGEYFNSNAKLYSGKETALVRDAGILWDLIAHRIPSTFESAGRLAVRKRALKNLEDRAKKEGTTITPEIKKNIEEQASYDALKVLNFADGGEYAKKINQFVPFFNVGIIASRNLVRHARSNPKEFTYKVAQLAGFSAALASWNNSLIGDDNNEMGEYYRHNISEHEKASNFIIMTKMRYKNSDGNLQYLYFKIPKSQEQSLFSGLAEYGSMAAAGIDSYNKENYLKHRAFKDAKGIFSYLPDGGNLLPPIFKGPLSYFSDYDWFRAERYTTSDEMLNRKDADEYDPIRTPERWKTIGEATGLSPIRLQGAFKSTIPTNNQWGDISNMIYTTAFGEDTKAILIRNETQGTVLDRFEKQLDKAGASEEEKREIYKTLALEVLPKIPGAHRLLKLTSPKVIDENRDDVIAQDASDSFHDTEAMKEAAYRFKKDNISREELIETAKNISDDPLVVKRALGQAKAAIRLKRGTPEAFNIVFSGVSSSEGRAKLLYEKVQSISPERGLDLIKEIRNTGLFSRSFWVEYKKFERGEK